MTNSALRSTEELNQAKKAEFIKSSRRAGSAVNTESQIDRSTMKQGHVLFFGDADGRGRVATNPFTIKKATARKAAIDRGETIDEAPVYRGQPNHQQYQRNCDKKGWEFQVTHDGYIVYNSENGIAPAKLTDEDCKELGIDPEVFNQTNLMEIVRTYPTPEESKAIIEKDIDTGNIVITKAEFTEMILNQQKVLDELAELKAGRSALFVPPEESPIEPAITGNKDMDDTIRASTDLTSTTEEAESNPWNNYVQRLINSGDIAETDVLHMADCLDRDVVKADVDAFRAHGDDWQDFCRVD